MLEVLEVQVEVFPAVVSQWKHWNHSYQTKSQEYPPVKEKLKSHLLLEKVVKSLSYLRKSELLPVILQVISQRKTGNNLVYFCVTFISMLPEISWRIGKLACQLKGLIKISWDSHWGIPGKNSNSKPVVK